ncbi:class II fructose-bisphosphate aldolase [Xylanimonas ulmi]|uniref:Fructose-bisphosphate aldolase n=1 Tax=Xylanimonas ulmi TaxID=228973 RepID=A0A4Q7LZK1_9MICO|nr:class II fructose-bisphosphate aldolase [Xylanibacterium ulmi]RZS59837.1 fructose-bisphosphate aldolase [Xylanibacterium ulmi]
MPLVPTAQLIERATARRRGVGAFNVLHLETAEALAGAAEDAGHGLILQISQNLVRFHGALRPVASATMAVASASSAPIAVHLDHAQDEDLVDEAIALGFGSVMYDGAALPYGENVAATRRVVARARAAGVFVEAELGEVGGKDGVHAPGARTDPDEARGFVADTGVDALAVAVGSSHAMATRTATLDIALVADLADAVAPPLVLHGSSGVPDDQMVAAIRAGIRKVNVSTHLNKAFTGGVRTCLAADAAVVDSRAYLGAGRAAMRDEAARLLRLFAT